VSVPKRNISTDAGAGVINHGDPQYPLVLVNRLGESAPVKLWALGNLEILRERKTALFCSSTCPGSAILTALEGVKKMRDSGVTVISGFHSPVEKECLNILLRGRQPIVICPARSLQGIRLPPEWKKGIDTKRLLILSPFASGLRRATTTLAQARNQFASALADEVFIPYTAPGGLLEQMSEQIRHWQVPMYTAL
jgi:predicted Rossmann fold nucleotide-binding protein DprA/Smf involved in DNA uptake